MRRFRRCLALLILSGCGSPPPQDAPIFVRDGQILSGKGSINLPGDRHLVEGPWSENAPHQAECVPLFHAPLEDMSRLAASGAPAPDTAMAWSPDGQVLAVGTFGGFVRLIDGWTGKERAARQIAEGMVRELVWSKDGKSLYIGEQSPDALVAELNPIDLATRWSVRLADDIETSPLPAADDIYGPYSLPGVYTLKLLENGDLLVVGAHGWTPASGQRQNRSRMYRLSPSGQVLARWPSDKAADAVLLHPVNMGDNLLLSISRSAAGTNPDLPIGGVALFDLGTLAMKWARRFPVLAPHFKEVFIWDGLGLGRELAMAGLGDGRVFLLNLQGEEKALLTPGVPIQAAGVPIATGVGFGTIVSDSEDRAYFVTTGTNIPFGSADPMARPPSAHPAQNTVHAVDATGKALWSRQLEHASVGIAVSPDTQEITVAAGPRQTDTRTDLFGAVILDRSSGQVRATCATEGPAHFRIAYGPDGRRIAVSESPYLQDGSVKAQYQITVFR